MKSVEELNKLLDEFEDYPGKYEDRLETGVSYNPNNVQITVNGEVITGFSSLEEITFNDLRDPEEDSE